MTRRFRLTAVLAGWVLLVATAAADQKVTFATFNCEFLTRPKVHMKFGERFNLARDRKNVWNQPGYRDKKFHEAAEAVARFIVKIDADVIGLEEVGDERDVGELHEAVRAAGLDYPYWVAGKSLDPVTHQNVALFSRYKLSELLSPIPGLEAYDTELDDPDAERWTELTKGLRVAVHGPGQTFYVYVLHLKSERGGHESDARRIAQASIVRRNYLPLLAAGKNVIVMGDLNDGRNQPAIRRIRGRDDIQPDLIQTGRADYFDFDKLDTRWTYEYMGVRGQIDHILLSTSFKHICKRIHARTMEQHDPRVSDHRPFIVDLNLRAAAPGAARPAARPPVIHAAHPAGKH